jgi:hypothetical protein
MRPSCLKRVLNGEKTRKRTLNQSLMGERDSKKRSEPLFVSCGALPQTLLFSST